MKMRFMLLSAASGIGITVISACGGTQVASNGGGSYGAGSNSGSSPSTAPSSTPTGGVAGNTPAGAVTLGTTMTSLGTFLVGPNGMTLYEFDADTGPQSTCTGNCAHDWPPLTGQAAPTAGSGIMQSLLSTSQRSDGTLQAVYNGHPLYYFVGDHNPGDTKGEGVNAYGAGWDVLRPDGSKIDTGGS
jgi:predicted lipoprotein with Yx(FWY)xxD motif